MLWQEHSRTLSSDAASPKDHVMESNVPILSIFSVFEG